MDRQICVADTSSVINICNLDLAGRRIIHYLCEMYEIIIPKGVEDELIYRGVEISPIIKVEETSMYIDCLEIVRKWYHKNNRIPEFEHLGLGEKHCIALALFLARKNKKMNLLMLDDFPAKDLFNAFIYEQGVGLTACTPEVIIHIYGLFNHVSKAHVLAAINEYWMDNPPRHAERKESFLNRLEMSCRNLGQDICFLKCLKTGMTGFKT